MHSVHFILYSVSDSTCASWRICSWYLQKESIRNIPASQWHVANNLIKALHDCCGKKETFFNIILMKYASLIQVEALTHVMDTETRLCSKSFFRKHFWLFAQGLGSNIWLFFLEDHQIFQPFPTYKINTWFNYNDTYLIQYFTGSKRQAVA